MFTGLVREQGRVLGLESQRLCIESPVLRSDLSEGASIAVNGVCLTVASLTSRGFCAQLLPETITATNLGALTRSQCVNLEPPLKAGEEFGGHFVTGHVDGTVRLLEQESRRVDGGAETRRCRFELPGWLAPWVIEKGSVALDGVSLTVQSLEPGAFSVALIPDTLSRTTLGNIMPGMLVNVEADLLVKAVVRATQALREARQGGNA